MSFPVWIEIFGLKLHPHVVFELLAYSTGFQLYLRLRARWKLPSVLTLEQNLQLIAGCLFGAWAGSKILDIANAPQLYWAHRDNLAFLLSGKTLVGGLLGGWIGVELVKKSLGISFATGDVYVFPVLTGIAIGRLGCFLTGLEDGTCGLETALPFGINFGDGIARHPTQLYEIVFALTVGAFFLWRMRKPYPNGWLFRTMMCGYFLFRFAIEFLKPRPEMYLGLSAIQIASLAGALCSAFLLLKLQPAASSSSA
jgi:phosphatidylglycerol:prolipoprotein diacylglycerol transferase